jgi:hypothetical protein
VLLSNTGCLKIIVFRVRGLVGDILLPSKNVKKNAVTLKKILKLPIFVQKYLINILAMLYFPVFSRNVFSFIF